MIQHEVTFETSRRPAEVFAYLSDVARTPEWLSRCVRIVVLDGGALAQGSKLRYAYRDGNTYGDMDGEVATFEKDRRLHFRYWDDSVRVKIAFDIEASGSGSRVRQALELAPQSFMMKLMQPFIRRMIVRQTATDIKTLEAKLAAG